MASLVMSLMAASSFQPFTKTRIPRAGRSVNTKSCLPTSYPRRPRHRRRNTQAKQHRPSVSGPCRGAMHGPAPPSQGLPPASRIGPAGVPSRQSGGPSPAATASRRGRRLDTGSIPDPTHVAVPSGRTVGPDSRGGHVQTHQAFEHQHVAAPSISAASPPLTVSTKNATQSRRSPSCPTARGTSNASTTTGSSTSASSQNRARPQAGSGEAAHAKPPRSPRSCCSRSRSTR